MAASSTSELQVRFQVKSPESGGWDYIGLFPRGGANSGSDAITYEYNASSESEGQLTLSIDGYVEAGSEYEVRYVQYESDQAVGTSAVLRVT